MSAFRRTHSPVPDWAVVPALICWSLAGATVVAEEAAGPFPLGRPTYAQVADQLLPPVAASGREAVTESYADAGLPLVGQYLVYKASVPGDWLEQEVSVETEGLYEVVLWVAKAPDCGQYIVALDDARLGAEIDGYAPQAGGPEPILVGERQLTAGAHRLRLVCTGRNAAATASEIHVDCYLIRPKPVGAFVGEWLLAGPFTGEAATAAQPPADVQWKTVTASQGLLDVGRGLQRVDNATAWARAIVRSPDARETYLWIGSDDGVTVWLNGQQVHSYTEARPCLPDQDLVKVSLKAGDNELLCRVDNQQWDWQLRVRPHDPAGDLVLALPEAPRPQPVEVKQLGERVQGFVVWESNRSGQWQLYRVETDGTGFRQLSQFPKDPLAYDSYLRPRVSPDGTQILFAYGRKGRPCEAWLISTEGGDARKVADGNPLNWSRDGQSIYLLRDSQVWQHPLAGGQESLVSDTKLSVSGSEGGTVGTLRADGKSVVVRASSQNEYYVFGNPKPVKTMGGCEARFTDDGKFLYWVQGPKHFRVWNLETDQEQEFFGEPAGKWNYTYFPTVSTDNRWLAYGASPGQHSHSTSDYEIHLQELDNWKPVGDPVRLSFDGKTDRWPYLWIRK